MSTAFKSFTIDATMQLPSDGYTAECLTTAEFLSASVNDAVTLEAGFVDPATGTPTTVKHLTGMIDEYELSVGPNEIRARIRGRDNLNLLLDRPFKAMYFLTEPPEATQEQLTDRGITWTVGTFTARHVAQDVVAAAGLLLQWQCRDYTFAENFEAVGSGLHVLQTLVAPWSQVPMFRVDIFIEGTTVFLRERRSPMTADYTYAVPTARIRHLTLKKRPTRAYGRVTLRGRKVLAGLQAGGGGGAVFQPSNAERTSVTETFDGSGAPLLRIVRVETFRMPDKILTHYLETTTDVQKGEIVKREECTNAWEMSLYSQQGATSQARQLAQDKKIEGVHKDDPTKTFQQIERETTSFAYEEGGFLSASTTVKEEITFAKKKTKLKESRRITKTLKEVENLKVEEVTTTEKMVSDKWVYDSVVSQVSAGLAPGGRRPPRTIISGKAGGIDATTTPLVLEQVLSGDWRAQDVEYSNPHLTQADLTYLMAQFMAASGVWEYELSMDYVAMPWIRKGTVVFLTGLVDADGVTPIPLSPALVVQQTLSVAEGGSESSLISRLTATYWGA